MLTREAGEEPAELGESVAVEPLLGVLHGGRGEQVLQAERTGLEGALTHPAGTGSQRPTAAVTYITAHGQGLHWVGWGAVAAKVSPPLNLSSPFFSFLAKLTDFPLSLHFSEDCSNTSAHMPINHCKPFPIYLLHNNIPTELHIHTLTSLRYFSKVFPLFFTVKLM